MDKSPLVSVIIPTRNEEKNIGRLLESVKKQSYKNIEVIVVDNTSVDTTTKIANKFTSKVYSRGPERSAQRNYGAEKSQGKLLLFLDADMELSDEVVLRAVEEMVGNKVAALVIPETTVGESLIQRVRRFEREMYLRDETVEVARMFRREVFEEFHGYDTKLTGPEDYDLPYRISKKYKIGRSGGIIYHHEENLTLARLLAKKYYYGKNGAAYAGKHPELILSQGTIIFRKAYLRNWRKFINHPVIGLQFLIVRSLETIWAVAGYISAVGLIAFLRTFIQAVRTKL